MGTTTRAPHSARRRRRRLLAAAGLGLAALVVLVVGGSVAEHFVYRGHVLPNVELTGVRVAGEKNGDAYAAIAGVAAGLQHRPIRAKAPGRTFDVDPALIGYSIDVAATAREVRTAGRHGNPLSTVSDTVLRRFRPDQVALVVHYDDTRLEGLLDGWSNALRVGLVEGDLRFDGTTVVPVMPHAGTGLQRDEAMRRLVAALSSAQRADITLPTGVVQPTIGAAAVEAAATQARAVLARDHRVVAGSASATITPAQLAAMLTTHRNGTTLALGVDTTKLRAALGPAFAQVEQPPVDATFSVAPGGTVTVVPSRDGSQIDLDALGAALVRNEPTVVATVRSSHPAHDTAWARKLGITHQVATFTTNHPAGQPRVHNIHVAADVLNNTVVEPGKVFSLNEKLGPRTPDKGYVKAPILVEDGFGEDYGGGVSQLTTTLFNAVFFGGYEDTEHSPHHFYISRYPMGREATVNYPSVDLKFTNDTHHGVLIRASYSATSITVTLYGDNDGRTAREENRQIVHTEPITDQVLTCPVAKPSDDPNNACARLAAGERTTVQPGETGYDVQFDRVIDQPGQPERRTHYRVHYPMLPNRILVGAGSATSTTTVPPGGAVTTTTRPVSPPTTAKPSPPTTKRRP